jgi:RHH-type transcriptional regulator, rel operon repressor / antitoxin RelB
MKSGDVMSQITARIPDDLLAELDAAATSLRRTRADVIRQAVEYYLDDYEDIRAAVSVLRDPADPVLDWESVRSELLNHD